MINTEDLQEDGFTSVKWSITNVPTTVEEFVKEMDTQTIKMLEADIIIKDEISNYELNDDQKELVEQLKERANNVRERITKNKKTIKDLMKKLIDGIKECKDIYEMMALKQVQKQITDDIYYMQRDVSE